MENINVLLLVIFNKELRIYNGGKKKKSDYMKVHINW